MKYKISDLIDIEKSQSLLDSFCNAVGIAAAIIDLNGEVLVGSQWQKICTDFHRVNEETYKKCIESDTQLANDLELGKRFSIYQCRNGLTDAASPIIIEDEHIANAFVGQFFLKPPDREFFIRQASNYEFKENDYLDALSEVPIIAEKDLPAILNFLTTFSETVAEMGLDRLRQKETEVALRESEERYRNLFMNNQSVMLIINPENAEIVDANPAAIAYYGWSLEELTSMKITDINTLAEDQVFQEIQKVKSDQHKNFIFQHRLSNGDIRDVEVYSCPIVIDGQAFLYSIIHDITDRKRAEKEQFEALARFYGFADASQYGMGMADLEGHIVYVNSTLARMLGEKSTVDCLGKHFPSAYYPPKMTRKLNEEVMPALMQDGYWHGELELLTVDHRSVPTDENYFVIRDENAQPCYLADILTDITDRKKSEKALRDSEEKYRNFIEKAPIAMFTINKNGEFTYGNKKLFEMTGYQLQDWRNKAFHPIIHPEHLEFVKNKISDRMTGQGTPNPYEIKIFDASGKIVWVKITSESIYETDEQGVKKLVGIQSFVEDVTNRKLAEEALRESEEKFRILVEESPFGIALISDGGHYKYLNPKFIDIFGYRLEDIPTGNVWFKKTFPDEKYREHVISQWKSDQREYPVGEARSRAFAVKCKDGANKIIDFKPVTMSTGDQFIICEDITEAKQLEAQLQQAQKMESIGNLAGGVAHDFNNILSAILGYTELALYDVQEGTLLENHLKGIHSAGIRARDLTKQILAFARQAEGELKPIRMSVIAKDALKLLRSTIPTPIEIRQNIQSDSLVMGDPTQVHQVFMNLCTNAAQAMEETGGLLEVSISDTSIEDFRNHNPDLKPGDYLKIEFADTGTGIAPEIIDSIFEPYFTTKQRGQGTGMGLATVYGIVKRYNGDLKVESEVGKGTIFTVYLPLIKTGETKEEPVPEVLPSGYERILFVDDEPALAEISRQLLERQGYEVTIRVSSVEALALFKQKPNDFDLVITDMNMPNLTGDDLALELKKIRPDIPVILCTGYSKKLTVEKAAEIGIKEIVYKPAVKADLAKTVRKVLDEIS